MLSSPGRSRLVGGYQLVRLSNCRVVAGIASDPGDWFDVFGSSAG